MFYTGPPPQYSKYIIKKEKRGGKWVQALYKQFHTSLCQNGASSAHSFCFNFINMGLVGVSGSVAALESVQHTQFTVKVILKPPIAL